MLRVFLVDDEELSLLELQFILEKNAKIEICGMATNAKEALKEIINIKPDVVFLDIQLNDMDLDGMKIAETIKSKNQDKTKIIFVTAYDEYALKAFELNAIDYILKPFSQERIKETLGRIGDPVTNNGTTLISIESLNKIAIEIEGKLKVIDLEEIIFVEAEGRNTKIYTENTIFHTNHSLKMLEKRLSNNSFFKPHRSYLINITKINEIIPWFNSSYQIVMKNYPQRHIPITRQNLKAFKNIVGI